MGVDSAMRPILRTVDKARALLGHAPTTRPAKGIARQWAWLQARG